MRFWIRRAAVFLVLLSALGCEDETGVPGTLVEDTIADWEFHGRAYFFVADPNGAAAPRVDLRTLRVYLDDRDYRNDLEMASQPAQAWMDPGSEAGASPPSGPDYRGFFHILIEEDDYVVICRPGVSMPVVRLSHALPGSQILAVAYRDLECDCDVGGFYGPAPEDTVLQLKMIAPAQDLWGTDDLTESAWADVRRLELRNVYRLSYRNIPPGSLVLHVFGKDGSAEITNESGLGRPLLAVLGLDQGNDVSGAYGADGLVDSQWIDYAAGEIFFPDLRPFDPDSADVFGTGGRERSWPPVGHERPDTLGWNDRGRSPETVREMEAVPEIYDLRADRLSREGEGYRLYTISAVYEKGDPR